MWGATRDDVRNPTILVACCIASCAASTRWLSVADWTGAPWPVGGLMALAGAVALVRMSCTAVVPDVGASVQVTRRLAEVHVWLTRSYALLLVAGFGTDVLLIALKMAAPREMPRWLDASTSGLVGLLYGYVAVRAVRLLVLDRDLHRAHDRLRAEAAGLPRGPHGSTVPRPPEDG